MDRATLEELLDYDGWVWQQISGALSSQGADAAKPASGSGWPALRDCLGHMAQAFDIWLSRRDGAPLIGFDVKGADSLASIDAYRKQVLDRFRDYLASQTDEQLHTDRDVNAWEGTRRYTPAEILGNLVAHDRGHHGDVSTLFYQLALDLPMIDYRCYVDAKR